jgi:hypothetical protein
LAACLASGAFCRNWRLSKKLSGALFSKSKENTMNRRDLLKSSLFAAGTAATLKAAQNPIGRQANAHSWPEAPRETNGSGMPNVLWICADQQRFDTIEGLNNTPYALLICES